ncbi:hypothetical protein NA57DRAFT_77804 [Rhizodiscina lignyota]|uniref:Eukaryotic translation initiation factor 3 30 kDa subunit n=1 Tax=Rhizodiscina lignyota TaxID=1504668 RepID=A0A9P4ICN4_9PEZI|nr:hypothetical protein NA57DRAFT_77804 [Rhizodiscina lignyota]
MPKREHVDSLTHQALKTMTAANESNNRGEQYVHPLHPDRDVQEEFKQLENATERLAEPPKRAWNIPWIRGPRPKVNLADMAVFNPTTADEFDRLSDALVAAINSQVHKKPSSKFIIDLIKGICEQCTIGEITLVIQKLQELADFKRLGLKMERTDTVKEILIGNTNKDIENRSHPMMNSRKWSYRVFSPRDFGL